MAANVFPMLASKDFIDATPKSDTGRLNIRRGRTTSQPSDTGLFPPYLLPSQAAQGYFPHIFYRHRRHRAISPISFTVTGGTGLFYPYLLPSQAALDYFTHIFPVDQPRSLVILKVTRNTNVPKTQDSVSLMREWKINSERRLKELSGSNLAREFNKHGNSTED
ncbi:hypothetical protein Btru_057193 [Bulinus truncatus]|nr:hypothetical protein Btru_057193 [Bulinus truncatus]